MPKLFVLGFAVIESSIEQVLMHPPPLIEFLLLSCRRVDPESGASDYHTIEYIIVIDHDNQTKTSRSQYFQDMDAHSFSDQVQEESDYA